MQVRTAGPQLAIPFSDFQSWLNTARTVHLFSDGVVGERLALLVLRGEEQIQKGDALLGSRWGDALA